VLKSDKNVEFEIKSKVEVENSKHDQFVQNPFHDVSGSSPLFLHHFSLFDEERLDERHIDAEHDHVAERFMTTNSAKVAIFLLFSQRVHV